MNAMNEIANL